MLICIPSTMTKINYNKMDSNKSIIYPTRNKQDLSLKNYPTDFTNRLTTNLKLLII